MAKYQEVTQAFKKFFFEENLLSVLENKAGAEDVNKLQYSKASRGELEETKKLIQNLNERVKHLANVQHEFAGSLQPVSNEINQFNGPKKKEIYSKINHIKRQSKIINDWINETDLEKSSSQAIIPKQI